MKRRGVVVALAAAACATICAIAIWASWEPDGVPVCTAIEDQWKMEITNDGAGGAFLVWNDRRTESDVYAQQVDHQGNPLWANDGLVICDTTGSQSSPKIASDGAGGAIIVWTDVRSSSSDIYAQRVSADGTMLWQRHGALVVG